MCTTCLALIRDLQMYVESSFVWRGMAYGTSIGMAASGDFSDAIDTGKWLTEKFGAPQVKKFERFSLGRHGQ